MIEYTLSDSGSLLVFEERVVEHFAYYRQIERDSREAGGQLFASIDNRNVRLERATGPRASDHRGTRYFIPDRSAERREIEQLFEQGLFYVGDWHTHAEPHPRPSIIDISSSQDTFRKSRHRLAGFVLAIVGTSPLPAGLFVGIVNGSRWRQLSQHRVRFFF